MGKLKAPLDGKNVTTDWIGDVFDNCEYTIDGQSIVGFIGHSPVFAAWHDNDIVWKSILGNENCMELLEKRLAAYEDDENSNICSECRRITPMVLLQLFYFKEDNL